MIDLLHMSEEELEELWIYDPDILDELVRDSKLEPYELAEVFVKHPSLQDTILKYSDPMELYNGVVYASTDFTDNEHNWGEYEKYISALNAITQYGGLSEAEEELEEFYAEHPEFDNRPDSQIPVGMSIEEYSEAMGVHINEFGEIIRPSGQESAKIGISPELLVWLNGESTPLKKREEQLTALENEAKTISEAEALIDKQNAKEGQSIGE